MAANIHLWVAESLSGLCPTASITLKSRSSEAKMLFGIASGLLRFGYWVWLWFHMFVKKWSCALFSCQKKWVKSLWCNIRQKIKCKVVEVHSKRNCKWILPTIFWDRFLIVLLTSPNKDWNDLFGDLEFIMNSFKLHFINGINIELQNSSQIVVECETKIF